MTVYTGKKKGMMPGFEHLWDLNELDSGLTEAKLTTQRLAVCQRWRP